MDYICQLKHTNSDRLISRSTWTHPPLPYDREHCLQSLLSCQNTWDRSVLNSLFLSLSLLQISIYVMVTVFRFFVSVTVRIIYWAWNLHTTLWRICGVYLQGSCWASCFWTQSHESPRITQTPWLLPHCFCLYRSVRWVECPAFQNVIYSRPMQPSRWGKPKAGWSSRVWVHECFQLTIAVVPPPPHCFLTV